MAEPEKTEKAREAETPLPEKKSPMAKSMPLLIVGGAVVVFAASGFLVGRLFGTRGQAQTVAAATPEPKPATKDTNPKDKKNECWYYELDPVVASLNEPGGARYVRITLTLEITGAWPELEAKPTLDQKRPLLKHWLTLYLSNQTTEDTRGKTNLLRMQSNISDILNQGLFPNAQPRIVNILFKEFAIQ
jgi:flagellar basal body-associated protein FliL